MQVTDLRIALFSGNYNYVRDGANQSLNRLVEYLLRQGAQVRVYAPTVDDPAFPHVGDLVSVPSIPIPTREEYRLAVRLPRHVQRDVEAFKPNVFHVAAPDFVAHRAVTLARRWKLPVISSVHTRFDTYFQYYGLKWFEPVARAIMRRYYRRCDAIVVPAESTAAIMRAQRMNRDISIWARGVDRTQFHPGRRDMDWRRNLGVEDDALAIAVLGRLVMEKGLDVFVEAIEILKERGVKHRVVVIGEGPAKPWFEENLPDGIFLGEQVGTELARALASTDVLFNPSTTETFGNVTLESMACALPVVAAIASGTTNLVHDGETGQLVDAGDAEGFADALQAYANNPALRGLHGEAGLAFAETMDWDHINSAVVKVYLRVIKRKKRFDRLVRRNSFDPLDPLRGLVEDRRDLVE